jgi:hypothetical protein
MLEAIKSTKEKLEKKSDSWTVVCHPNIISYDYRIAWTWEELERRNQWNITVDGVRILF